MSLLRGSWNRSVHTVTPAYATEKKSESVRLRCLGLKGKLFAVLLSRRVNSSPTNAKPLWRLNPDQSRTRIPRCLSLSRLVSLPPSPDKDAHTYHNVEGQDTVIYLASLDLARVFSSGFKRDTWWGGNGRPKKTMDWQQKQVVTLPMDVKKEVKKTGLYMYPD